MASTAMLSRFASPPLMPRLDSSPTVVSKTPNITSQHITSQSVRRSGGQEKSGGADTRNERKRAGEIETPLNNYTTLT